MPTIVMATSQPAQWRDFAIALEEDTGVSTDVVSTGAEVIQASQEKDLLAVILDREIQGISGAQLVHELISINAMIHVAWASELTEEEFHEATEGLGILMKLSPQPDVNEARRLTARLRQISGAI